MNPERLCPVPSLSDPAGFPERATFTVDAPPAWASYRATLLPYEAMIDFVIPTASPPLHPCECAPCRTLRAASEDPPCPP